MIAELISSLRGVRDTDVGVFDFTDGEKHLHFRPVEQVRQHKHFVCRREQLLGELPIIRLRRPARTREQQRLASHPVYQFRKSATAILFALFGKSEFVRRDFFNIASVLHQGDVITVDAGVLFDHTDLLVDDDGVVSIFQLLIHLWRVERQRLVR